MLVNFKHKPITKWYKNGKVQAPGYKIIFMLNSTGMIFFLKKWLIKAKLLKYKKNPCIIHTHDVFFLLTNVKMPTNCWHFNIYAQDKYHA